MLTLASVCYSRRHAPQAQLGSIAIMTFPLHGHPLATQQVAVATTGPVHLMTCPPLQPPPILEPRFTARPPSSANTKETLTPEKTGS